jgi:c-di-GMP-binding flagellar brake protein YcgR
MRNFEKYIGKKVMIEIIGIEGEKVGPSYQAIVLDYRREERFLISFPIFNKFSLPLPKNTYIQMNFDDVEKQKIIYTGIIGNKVTLNELDVQEIKIVNVSDSDVRRNKYFTIDNPLMCEYKIQNKEYEKFNIVDINNRYTEGKTRNISGDGFLMLVNDDIEVDTKLEIILWLDKYRKIKVMGEVKSKHLIGNYNKKNYVVNVVFQKVSTQIQDTIIRYLFDNEKRRRSVVY